MNKTRKIIFILTFLMLIPCGDGYAAKEKQKKLTPAQEFTNTYNEMKAVGGQEFYDWRNNVYQDGSDKNLERYKMLKNLEEGKTAEGKKKSKKQLAQEKKALEEAKKNRGFMGDPNDPGPTDWSDWNIETDANGNVTGFKEKFFEDKDKDGDGKISDEERKEWEEEEKKRHEEAGGAPGEVDPTPEWDKNNDGIPDKGFELDCWKCFMPPEQELNECHDGLMGGCDPNPCSIASECVGHSEEHDGNKYECHNCYEKDDANIPWCEQRGFSSHPNCSGRCPRLACAGVDILKSSGKILPSNKTRERGATQRCYTCMDVSEVEITYVVTIIETPFGRYILDKSQSIEFEDFVPSQVMALAKVSNSPQGVMDIAGLLPGASGALGMLSAIQSMDLGQIAGMLQQGLDKGRSYSDNCFENDFQTADFSSAQTPPSGKPEQKKKKKKKEQAVEPSPPAQPGTDIQNELTVGGPVVACGQKGKEKALAILDAAGRPIQLITKEELKENPNAVFEALQKAQSLSDTVMSIRQQGVEGFLKQKAQSVIKSFVDKMAKKMFSKSRDQKDKDDRATSNITPNDPFYAPPSKDKKKKLLGIFGSSKKPKKITIGSGLTMGKKALGATGDDDKKEAITYQWGLHDIGFTPLEDPQSAWQFVDYHSRNVIVAVIDSGMDLTHVDGPQYIWRNENEIPANGIDDDNNGYIDDIHGWNFLNNNNDLTDLEGHGSFVAGIIAAKWNNGVGIAGINPGAVIMPIKVANEEGETNSFDIFRAINYAVDNGAKVINVSLGGRGISQFERKALNYADQMGVFVAVASGNVGEDISEHSPASSRGAFAVGSLDQEGTRSTISNFGPNNAVLAPGDQIFSLIAQGTGKGLKPSVVKAGYYPKSGTSFSTPMVAATASLLLVQNPELTPDDIEDILHRSADDMYDPGWDGLSGAGKLNASAALQNIVQRSVTVKINRIEFIRGKRDRIEYVDVFGTVRGSFKNYHIELGKGARASRFKPVTGSYALSVNNEWIARIDSKEYLKGSSEWILGIRAFDHEGQEQTAQVLINLKK